MSLLKFSNRSNEGRVGYVINFPRECGVKVVEAGIVALEEAVDHLQSLQRETKPTFDAVVQAKAARDDQGKRDALGKPSTLSESITAVHAAEHAVELLDARIEGAKVRQADAVNTFHALVLTNEEALKAAAKPKAQNARLKLVAARRMLTDAEAELSESAGLLEMFEFGDAYRHAIRAHAGSIPLSAAIEGAGDAVRALGIRESELG